MADIIEVATHEFSEKGLAGARIDEIAEAMRTSKRMIYYYFGSKEGLYLAVLEEAYRRIRSIEAELHLEDLAPEEALRKLVGLHLRLPARQPRFHPPGDEREHPPRRVPGAEQDHPAS